VLVDEGSTLNLIRYRFYKKIGKRDDEIIQSNIQLLDFIGDVSEVKGVYIVDLTVESKTSGMSFCVVDIDGSYKETGPMTINVCHQLFI